MTEPRRKEWLFDEYKYQEVMRNWKIHVSTPQEAAFANETLRYFIQSEIKRNVREFAERILKVKNCDAETDGICCNCRYLIFEEIDAALKEYDGK